MELKDWVRMKIFMESKCFLGFSQFYQSFVQYMRIFLIFDFTEIKLNQQNNHVTTIPSGII